MKAVGRQILPEEPLIELLLTDLERKPRLQASSTVLNPLLITGASMNVPAQAQPATQHVVSLLSLKLTFDLNIITAT